MVALTHRLQTSALLSKSVPDLSLMGLRSWLTGNLGPRARGLLLTRPYQKLPNSLERYFI
jgi:hypothetical protein